MKKIISVLITISLFCAISIQSVALGEKSLEVTLTGYTLLYQTFMQALGQKTDVRRDWISEDQAQLQLTDKCFCVLTTESKSDFANVIEVLHTAAPESDKDMLSVRCSMVSTIATFDPDLEIDTITDMVMNILPKSGEYYTDYCKYRYTKAANVIMLYISPK
jgi:hypothetical protein